MTGPTGKSKARSLALLVAVPFLLDAAPAWSHAGDRGFVLLLPTGYYLVAGAMAVAASFVVMALAPVGPLERLARWRWPLPDLPEALRMAVSLLSFLAVCGLIYAGLAGSRDPLSNPLPLVFWSVWWIGLTLAVAIIGNLWRWLDPWYGMWRLAIALLGLRPETALLRLPPRIGYWPAIAVFFAFAWFELVYVAPEDPQRLAIVLGLYWLTTFLGIMFFGHAAWVGRVECFSVFFAMISRVALLGRERGGSLSLALTAARAATAGPLPPSASLFILLALSTVSFDGFSRTFLWLDWIGVNPLEFPGRSAVLAWNSFGLAAAFVTLAGLFFGSVWVGKRLAGVADFLRLSGTLVWSIPPIALAYHFAHYLPSLAVNGQYALAAISDPLSRGWNLFGTAGYHVLAGATAGHQSAWLIWNLQAGAIVVGHILAVAVAHVAAYRLAGRRAGLLGLPLAILMVGYTVFGLWLLSSPTGY